MTDRANASISTKKFITADLQIWSDLGHKFRNRSFTAFDTKLAPKTMLSKICILDKNLLSEITKISKNLENP